MKRVLAMLCIIVLIVSVIVMLIAAISGSPQSGNIFIAAVAVNIILPVMLWVYLQAAKFFKSKGEKIRQEENK